MINRACGVDVSSEWLDANVHPDERSGRFANTVAGALELAAFCREAGVDIVVMEATGGHERTAWLVLWEQGLPCALVNPRNARRFAEALGLMEKTDGIDASVLARFAFTGAVRPTPPATAAQMRLKSLVLRLRQVTGDLTVQKQRRYSAPDEEARESIGEVIALLNRQSRKLEGEIASMIDDDPLWATLDETFRSVKGVAGRTVARLMAELPEIGLYSNKAISKLAGLAPLADDSGKRNGKRRIRGGRESVRSILFLVARTVARFDPTLAAFRDRLRAKGKPILAVRTAMAHKLLVRLNAKARDAREKFAHAT